MAGSAARATVACGNARRADGTLWAWGGNAVGQLGLGHTTDTLFPTQIGTATTWAGGLRLNTVHPGICYILETSLDLHHWDQLTTQCFDLTSPAP